MGSLSSRPSVPAQPQVVYVPTQSTATSSASTTQTAESSSGAGEESSAPQSAAEARTESLLRRSRGRLGTVQTSLRGLLGISDTSAERKTLLGE